MLPYCSYNVHRRQVRPFTRVQERRSVKKSSRVVWQRAFRCGRCKRFGGSGTNLNRELQKVGLCQITIVWLKSWKAQFPVALEAHSNPRIEASQVAFFKTQKNLGVWRNMFIKGVLNMSNILNMCQPPFIRPTETQCALGNSPRNYVTKLAASDFQLRICGHVCSFRKFGTF